MKNKGALNLTIGVVLAVALLVIIIITVYLLFGANVSTEKSESTFGESSICKIDADCSTVINRNLDGPRCVSINTEPKACRCIINEDCIGRRSGFCDENNICR